MSDEKNKPEIPDESNWERDLEKAAQRVGREDFKNRLKKLEAEQAVVKSARIISLRRILSLAAGFFLLVASAGLWFANNNFSDEGIAKRNFQEPNFSGIRGTSDDTPFEYAVELFYKKDYVGAFKILSSNRKTNREDFFRGYIRLKEGSFEDAEKIFTQILRNEDPTWKAEADWFLAMTLFSSGKLDKAEGKVIEIKNDSNHPFQKKATKLLDELNSPWRKIVF